ncbi:unnamed protein product [Prorocentrum cordatum]|uniref:HTH OST-type domain-containing protein n=1 Tax=Prorocentrum cordatum TaxID=2364126 RepID=A0ABN9V9N6_9DINO|nr:unnamed protein product [Polarella glacialis]
MPTYGLSSVGVVAARLGDGLLHGGGAPEAVRGHHPQHLTGCLARFPICGPKASRGRSGHAQDFKELGWPASGGSSESTDSAGAAAVYQGRASHPKLGKSIPLQIELLWADDCASGTWFMFGKSVEAVAERSSEWHLVVRSAGSVRCATLRGRWASHNRVVGEFFFGADGRGTFELLQSPPVSLSPECARWGWGMCSRTSSAASCLAALGAPEQEPAVAGSGPPAETKAAAGQPPVTRAAAGKQVIFTTEAQLAEALAEVLKTHPNGIDLAHLKTTIRKGSGLWVSESFLGYKKLTDLIKSPIMSSACRIQNSGSFSRVFAFAAAAGKASYDAPEVKPARSVYSPRAFSL